MSVDLDEYLKTELSQDLVSDRPRVRKDAVTVLARLGSGTRTLEILKTLADSDPDEGLRGHARSGYSELWSRVQKSDSGRRRVADAADPGRLDLELFTRALDDPSPIWRLRALLEGIHLRDARMLELVLARLDREPDDWVVATMVKAVAVCGDKTQVTRIEKFLKDESRTRLVANTIEAIAMLDPQAARGMLRPFVNSMDSRVQSTAAMALFRVEPREALEVLRGMSRSHQVRTRDAAVHCLVRIDEPLARDLLLAMPVFENNYGLVEKVVGFFSAHGDPAAGCKALKLSQMTTGVAGTYAYRRIVRGICDRCGISEGDLHKAATVVEVEAFVRMATAERERPGTQPLPPITVNVARPRAERPVGNVLLVGVFGALLAVGAVMAVPGGDGAGLPKAVTSSVSPEVLAGTHSPAAFNNAVVAWDLTVKDVDPTGRQLHLTDGRARVAAVFDHPIRDVRPGDRVRVRGRVAGRSRFGPIHLEGHAVERP